MVTETLIVGPFQVNCYIVGCEESGEGMIIDPGDEAEVIVARFRELGLKLKYILLTHGHVDHISAVAEVRHALGGKIAMNEKDHFLVESAGAQAAIFDLQPPAPFTVDQNLSDGDQLTVGTLAFKVLETPGHSPGGICFQSDVAVFVGDTLFFDSIGRTDLPGGSYEQLLRSIRDKLLPLPDNVRVFPGHGQPTSIGRERKYNPFLTGD